MLGLKVNFKKIVGIIKIIRPSNVLISGLTISVAVLIFGGEGFDILRLALMAGIVGVLIDAGANVINDFFDVEIDRINKPHRPIPSGLVSKRFALFIYFVCTILGLLVASFLNKMAFMIVFFSSVAIFLYINLTVSISVISFQDFIALINQKLNGDIFSKFSFIFLH